MLNNNNNVLVTDCLGMTLNELFNELLCYGHSISIPLTNFAVYKYHPADSHHSHCTIDLTRL